MKKCISIFLSVLLVVSLFSVSASAASYIKGDANNNGSVEITDATAIQNNGSCVKARVQVLSNGVLGELTEIENIEI